MKENLEDGTENAKTIQLNSESTIHSRQNRDLSPALLLPGTAQYAGFWIRTVAFVIDIAAVVSIMALVSIPVAFILMACNIKCPLTPRAKLDLHQSVSTFLFLVIHWLYYSFMESSTIQATIGKLALHILVTDLNGNRVTFWRASGRTLAKPISDFTLGIGFFLAGFTKKKQALHDLIAGCLVVKK